MIGNLVYSMRDKLESILRSNICSEETCLVRSEMDEVISDLCAKRKQKGYLKMRRVKNRKIMIAKKENSKSSIRPFLRSFSFIFDNILYSVSCLQYLSTSGTITRNLFYSSASSFLVRNITT